jgi:NADH-quinone oxidoreductase subunit N
MIQTPRFVYEPVLPEMILAGMAIVGLLYEAIARRPDRRVHLLLGLLGVSAAAATSVRLWAWSGDRTVMGGMIVVDDFGVVGRLILVSVAALGLLLGYHYFSRERWAQAPGEFAPLVLFATAGMTLIVVSADLIMVFLALEVLSLSLYVLTGITGTRRPLESAVKYFLLGATSSAFFLYGVAMAYGATASTGIADISNALAGRVGSLPIALLAVVFLSVGFAFKVSAAPFHMWTPDVYQGAPTPVVAYMSAATKVAAFLALIRVMTVAFQPVTWDWIPVIGALAVISIMLGSIVAIAQRDVKRMLAYSSIAQAGFILLGLTAGDRAGIESALFYLVVYAAMTLGAFGIVMLAAARGDGRTELDSYAGLARRSPLLAALMAWFLLSLAGIPPTGGFIAKVGVFGAAIDAGNVGLVLVGVLASVVAAFFYLRVLVYMYMREPDEQHAEWDRAWWPRVALAVPAALILALGVFPRLLAPVLEQASVLRW